MEGSAPLRRAIARQALTPPCKSSLWPGRLGRGPAFEAEKTPALEREKKLALIEKAEGCSSRETERLLLEEAPDSKRLLQKDQVRFLGEGRFELKAVIDGETRGKLERLKFLLSHKNPSMGYGSCWGIYWI